MNIRAIVRFALTLALCLVAAGCSSNNAADSTNTAQPESTEAPQVPATEDSTPAVDVNIPPDASPELSQVEQPQPDVPDLPVSVDLDVNVDLAPQGIFADATAALESLASYRFTTSFVFTGEADGAIESGSIELSGDIMDAQRKHFVWRNLSDGEQFEVIQLEDQAWVYDGGEWSSVPTVVADAMSQAVLVFAPSVVWGGLFGSLETQSTYVGAETIDGIPAHHYTSTYQQWAGYWQGELLDATGDVWIADAGYPLRYDFAATGIDEDGDRGTISWTMRLTDVGGNIVIEPPM